MRVPLAATQVAQYSSLCDLVAGTEWSINCPKVRARQLAEHMQADHIDDAKIIDSVACEDAHPDVVAAMAKELGLSQASCQDIHNDNMCHLRTAKKLCPDTCEVCNHEQPENGHGRALKGPSCG